MAGFTLYLGNKNYSSWSMRGWLAMKHCAAPFEEQLFHLSAPGVREEIRRHSPTAKVPALRHGDRVIWDSLAIAEYLAELFPDRLLWPASPGLRAVARSVSAEMHSGFPALRAKMPFNVRRSSPGTGRAPEVDDEIRRVCEIWTDCRERFGGKGDFLFGDCCMADYMYAPVVSRFRTYAVKLDGPVREYAAAIWRLPHVVEWRLAAEAEAMVEPQFDL